MNSSPAHEKLFPRKRETWRSLTLRKWVLGLLLTSEIALFCGIIALFALSILRSGFVNVGRQSISDPAFSFRGAVERGRPLLWTSVPTLIFMLYRIFRGSVIDSLIVETPYMELNKATIAHPTKVEKSVYLDYRTSFAVVAWYKAFKNQHRFLGSCMLLSFVVSIILVPLAARLFAEGEELLPTDATINLFSAYEPPYNMSDIDYAGLMDAVSASWIHNASYPPGTDGTFALPQISPARNRQNYTITLDVTCPQLSLDCQAISSPATSTKIETDSIIRTKFSAIDRGCSISGDMLSRSQWSAYLRAFSESSCAESAGTSRVFFFYASYSGSSGELDGTTLVSCIPSYWNVTGTLNVISNVGFTGRFEIPAFSPKSPKVTQLPAFARQQFESAIMNVMTINTGSEINSPNRLAELVARYITAKGLERSETALIKAATTIYPAIYTMLNVGYFYPDLPSPVQRQGIIRIPENRLHVVPYASITMLVILGMLIVETVCLICFVFRHESILAEEPIGLIGAANLLHNSNISDVVSSFHSGRDLDGRLRLPLHEPGHGSSGSWWSTFFRKKATNTDSELLRRNCYVVRGKDCPCLQIVVDTGYDPDAVNEKSCGHSTSVGQVTATMTSHVTQR
ncbi:hypothetical protein DL98DRAFT_638531 [Cadophora sp. DSE1049]|nr:hypothetical protein DL98DRAFT_638531 [Cadophora sp. DSE1049]